MSSAKSLLSSVVRNPLSFSIIVLSLVILIVWIDYRTSIGSTSDVSSADISTLGQKSMGSGQPTDNSGSNIVLSPPSMANSGRSQPKIVDQFGSDTNTQSPVPAIEALVDGLETKVKSDPQNISNRILLAQTYRELGRLSDATQELRTIREMDPTHGRANLVLASILSQSEKQDELKESIQLLDGLAGDDSVQPYLVHMYRGDALMGQNDKQGALVQWKQALDVMPQSDGRYAALEKKIMDQSGNASSGS